MTVELAKETIYRKDFQAVLERNEDAWLKELREKAFDYFTENGFPTPKNEEWKYTNVQEMVSSKWLMADDKSTLTSHSDFVFDESRESVLVFTNGHFDKNSSKLSAIKNTSVLSFSETVNDEKYAEIFRTKLGKLVDAEKNAFTALNTAFIGEGVLIHLPKNSKIDAPIQLLFTTDEGVVSFPRVLIVADEFAEATFVETYVRAGETKYLTNAVVEISVADEAKIKHFRVQRESHEAFHISTTAAEVGRGSVYDTTAINLGGKLSRHDVLLKFNAEGGEAFVDGLYFLGESQHHDTHSVIRHELPNCTSHQTYKGILNDKSRGVFNGKVFVEVGASGTDGYQSNKNLLLSNEARVDTKPQLEIFNDDVKCSHGATVGQLEEEELFYLLSRGLNDNLARNLLTYGFAEEIINKIEIESIKKQLDEAVLNRLNVNLEA
jgi:Fe-S cluster assembly protein SufD